MLTKRSDTTIAVHSLETARSLVNPANEPEAHTAILASLGNVYAVTGPPDRAEAYLRDALEAAQTLHDASLSAHILNNLGNLYATRQTPQANDLSQAFHFYRQSADAAQRAGNDAMAARATTHAVMVMVKAYAADYAHLEGPETLKSLLDRALAYLRPMAASHAQVYDLINVGLAYDELRRYLPASDNPLLRQAADVLREAAAVAESLEDARAASYAWGHLGHLYEAEHRYRDALQLTQRAIFAVQQQHAPEALYRWQWQTGRLMRALGDRDAAIVAYQQAVETLQGLRESLSCAYGQSHTEFRTALGPLYFGLADLRLQRAAADPGTARANSDLQHARRAVEQFKVAELDDYWGNICIGASRSEPVSLETVSNTAVVVYPIVLPDRLELLVGLPGELKRFGVSVPADKLERAGRGFRRAVQEGSRAYKRLANNLYDWLVRPYEAELERLAIHTLVFVPDGVLRTVPLSALHDGRQFLIHKYALAVTPGLQLTDPRPLVRKKLRILTAGVTPSPDAGFSALPHVEQELKALERLLPGRVQRLPDLRLAALDEAIRKRPVSLIHIASHARFARDAEDSFLLASDGQKLTMQHLQEIIGHARFRGEPLALLTFERM